jgi:TolA-binding protein
MIVSLFLPASYAVLTGTRNVASADTSFKKKQHASAAIAYRNMLQENPDSLYASDARFGLAMTHMAADSPQKDYAQALHELEAFYKLYPGDWRALVV